MPEISRKHIFLFSHRYKKKTRKIDNEHTQDIHEDLVYGSDIFIYIHCVIHANRNVYISRMPVPVDIYNTYGWLYIV